MKASDFYFCTLPDYNEEFGDPDFFGDISFFAIVSKKFFDREQCWDDRSCWFHKILPDRFYESAESLFETDLPKEEARQALLDAGFIENEALGD